MCSAANRGPKDKTPPEQGFVVRDWALDSRGLQSRAAGAIDYKVIALDRCVGYKLKGLNLSFL